MSAQEIIASGKLELYVYGKLSPEEQQEVQEAMAMYPEVKKEVEAIETALIHLSEGVAPQVPSRVWSGIRDRIHQSSSSSSSRRNWATISGWAAAVIAVGGIFWMFNQNNDLNQQLNDATTENGQLRDTITQVESELADTNTLLDLLRSKDYNTILLPGNAPVAPEAYAKVYYNSDGDIAYIDATGLPDAPPGKVYQVWSLTLDPLTPTSMGLLDNNTDQGDGFYRFEDVPTPQAFGITLEPEGGSESPTLDQLYTLGTVSP